MRINIKRLVLVIVILILIAALIACAVFFAARFLFREREQEDMRKKLPTAEPPAGAQILTFPVNEGLVTAGYRNPRYNEKNGYPHYGSDITSARGDHAEVLASGDGVVLGTEFCGNSLGNIAVVQYDNVYVPQTGETVSLIARYYHMTSILVKKDDVVTQGRIIGAFDRSHKWYHHIHIELDTDLQHPFNTPQVAEASSSLLVRFPADGKTTLEPMSVLVLDSGQYITVHPGSDSCTKKDNPRFIAADK